MTSFEFQTTTLREHEYDTRTYTRIDRFEASLDGGGTFEIRKPRRTIDGAPGWYVWLDNLRLAWAPTRTEAIAKVAVARQLFFAMAQPERAALTGTKGPSGPNWHMVEVLRDRAFRRAKAKAEVQA